MRKIKCNQLSRAPTPDCWRIVQAHSVAWNRPCIRIYKRAWYGAHKSLLEMKSFSNDVSRGLHRFSINLGKFENYRVQKGDMKQCSYWGPTDLRSRRKKFCRPHGICVSQRKVNVWMLPETGLRKNCPEFLRRNCALPQVWGGGD
jgi:hypothetical protein